jgi:glycerophosphoryl diester phosphodiesterase
MSKFDSDLDFPRPAWFFLWIWGKYFWKKISGDRISNPKPEERIKKVKFVLGHRGAKGEFPENSIEGFLYASEIADGFELDTQILRDQKLVVMHDASVDRTTDRKGLVYNFDLKTWKTLKLENQESPPELEEVLALFQNKKTIINIEFKRESDPQKTNESIREFVRILSRLDPEKKTLHPQICVTSFSPLALYYFSKYNLGIRMGLLIARLENYPVSRLWKGMLSSGPIARALGVDFLVLDKNWILKSEEIQTDKVYPFFQNYPLWVYTVNSEQEWKKTQEFGVEGFITDFPKKAVNYFSEKCS